MIEQLKEDLSRKVHRELELKSSAKLIKEVINDN
jgi:hypothetical protein